MDLVKIQERSVLEAAKREESGWGVILCVRVSHQTSSELFAGAWPTPSSCSVNICPAKEPVNESTRFGFSTKKI